MKKLFNELCNSHNGDVHVERTYTALQDKFLTLSKSSIDDPKYGDLVKIVKELQAAEAKRAFIISATGKRPLGFETTDAEGDTAATDLARRKLTAYRQEQKEKEEEERNLTKNMANVMANVSNALAKLGEDDAPAGNATIHEDFVKLKQSVNTRMATIEEEVKTLHQSVNGGFSSILQAMQGGRGQNDAN